MTTRQQRCDKAVRLLGLTPISGSECFTRLGKGNSAVLSDWGKPAASLAAARMSESVSCWAPLFSIFYSQTRPG